MAIRITVRLEGLDAARQRLANISNSRARIVRGAQFFATKRFEEGLKFFEEEAPKGPTKELSKSIVLNLSDSGSGLEGAYTATAPHAGWVIEGTGEYGPQHSAIVPRTAKFLRFFWYKQDKWMRTRSVRGQPPNPFMIRARKRVKDMVFSTLPGDVREDVRLIVGGK